VIDPLLQLVIAAALALLFAGAALHKRGEPGRFRAQLAAYELLPPGLLRPVAGALPWCELSVALLLLPAVTRAAAGTAAAGLLLVYAAGMGINLLRGRGAIDCGCGGAEQPLSWLLVFRNLALASAAALLVAPATERVLLVTDALWLILLVPLLAITYAALGEITRNAALLRPATSLDSNNGH
jgi:hypothetical protein